MDQAGIENDGAIALVGYVAACGATPRDLRPERLFLVIVTFETPFRRRGDIVEPQAPARFVFERAIGGNPKIEIDRRLVGMEAGPGTLGAVFEGPHLGQIVAGKDIRQTRLEFAREGEQERAVKTLVQIGAEIAAMLLAVEPDGGFEAKAAQLRQTRGAQEIVDDHCRRCGASVLVLNLPATKRRIKCRFLPIRFGGQIVEAIEAAGKTCLLRVRQRVTPGIISARVPAFQFGMYLAVRGNLLLEGGRQGASRQQIIILLDVMRELGPRGESESLVLGGIGRYIPGGAAQQDERGMEFGGRFGQAPLTFERGR